MSSHRHWWNPSGIAPLIFAPEASRAFGTAVSGQLRTSPAGLEETTFEDGERRLVPLVSVEGRMVLLIQSLHDGPVRSLHDKLCDVLLLAAALKDAGALQVTFIAPYYCYARQDRRAAAGEPLSLRYVAQLIEASGIDRVIAMDVHNPAAFENAFRIPAANIECALLFAEHFAKSLADQDIRLVSPDTGGVKRAARLRETISIVMNKEVELTVLGKERIDHIVEAEEIPSTMKGRTAIVFDDMIATGATMLRAARACRKAGASYVIGAATHGLFLLGSEVLLEGELLDRVIVTDTTPLFRLPAERVAQKVTVLPAAPTLMESIGAVTTK